MTGGNVFTMSPNMCLGCLRSIQSAPPLDLSEQECEARRADRTAIARHVYRPFGAAFVSLQSRGACCASRALAAGYLRPHLQRFALAPGYLRPRLRRFALARDCLYAF